MFVTVRYGEDKSRLFNAQCKNGILLEYMKLHCRCAQNEVVEVSDEKGVVKNLRKFPTDYGSDYLKERESLVLLAVSNGTVIPGKAQKPVFTLSWKVYGMTGISLVNTLNQVEKAPESSVNSPANNRRQQTFFEGDEDIASKSFKARVRIINGNRNLSGSAKKSILRKSTRNLL